MSVADKSTDLIRVATLESPPLVYVDKAGPNIQYYGYLIDILNFWSKEANFKYEIYTPDQWAYGALTENGTWNGIIGEVAYDRADIGLAFLGRRSDREKVVDYIDLTPLGRIHSALFVKLVHRHSLDEIRKHVAELLSPLHLEVWLMVLAFIFLISICMWFTIRCSRDELCEISNEFTLANAILHIYMTIVSQGWTVTPDKWSSRIIVMFSWFLGIIISTCYTTQLISTLTTTENLVQPVKSLSEFLDKPDWWLAMNEGAGFVNDLKSSSNPSYRKLYERYVKKERILFNGPIYNKIDRFSQANIAFKMEHYRLQQAMGVDACLLVSFDLDNIMDTYATISKKRKSLRAKLNQFTLYLQEVGILDRIKKKWNYVENHLCHDSKSEFEEVTLESVFGAILLIILALCLSIICLCAEILIKSKKKGYGRNCYKIYKINF